MGMKPCGDRCTPNRLICMEHKVCCGDMNNNCGCYNKTRMDGGGMRGTDGDKGGMGRMGGMEGTCSYKYHAKINFRY